MHDVRRLAVGEDNEIAVTLDDLAREGARRMIAAALEAEVDEYVASFTDEVDEDGKRLVVRNGQARERRVTVGSGTVRIRAPRVNDKRLDEETGERKRFSSRILPAYARRSPKVTDVLPILYLRGPSTGDFGPALRDLLGEDASGLSASSIQRLTETWQAEHEAFKQRQLRFHRHAYLFVDGVHVTVRLGEDDRLCLLVVIGVREDGEKELLAVEDGYRESTDSWAAVFRDLRDRGLGCPKLVTGDGALGAWAALRDVFPDARRQACWVHKIANVLDALPKRLQPRAKTMLHEIMEAPARADARAALERFREEFDAKYPKAVAKLDRDWAALTAFYDFPAEHWRHLRTTNPIESSFATVKLRTRVTKGAGSKKAALAMAYKLLAAAQERWRRFNGHELVADVLAGATFKDGIRVTDDTTTDEKVAA
jgi:transposase-like protein